MKSNFDFLLDIHEFESFSYRAVDSEKSLFLAPYVTAMLCRSTLEFAVKWIHKYDDTLKSISDFDNINLSDLIHNDAFLSLFSSDMHLKIKYIITLGNDAVHNMEDIQRKEAIVSLKNLFDFTKWIAYKYLNKVYKKGYDETIIQKDLKKDLRFDEIEDIYELKLKEKDKEIQKLKRMLKMSKLDENIDSIEEDTPIKDKKVQNKSLITEQTQNSVVTTRTFEVEELIKNYKKVEFSDISIKKISILPKEMFKNDLIPLVSSLSTNSEKLPLTLINQLGHTKYMELKSAFGTLTLVVDRKKTFISDINLIEKIEKNPYIEKLQSTPLISDKPFSASKTIYGDEIKNKFHDMIRLANKELLITSPWVQNGVYSELIVLFERAIKRGVSIKVVYGMNEDNNKHFAESVETLSRYKSRLGSNFSYKKGNIYEEICICDDFSYLIGNYPLLSVATKNKKKFIKEKATYSENEKEVANLIKKFQNM